MATNSVERGESKASLRQSGRGPTGDNHLGVLPCPTEVLIPLQFALSPAACQLCHRAHLDPEIYGPILEQEGICVHEFCLYFASDIYPIIAMSDWVIYSSSAIQRGIEEAAEKQCCVCGSSGAAIDCWERSCERSFHLPCALRGECITQYFDYYRAFCSLHRPQQAVDINPEPETECLLCTELVDDTKTYTTMVCPVCQHSWFHRHCVQEQALHAGISAFKCMLCRDKELFQQEMLCMGIRIPKRPPSWETVEAFQDIMARHSRCDVIECLCPAGREYEEEEGPWQMLLCSSCAAEGTHRSCSNLTDSTNRWECPDCADPSTASSASSEMADFSSVSQAGSGPSRGSLGLESSSRFDAPGPVWVRVGSRLQRRAEYDPYSWPRRRRQRSRTSAPATASSIPSEAAPAVPHSLLAPEASSLHAASQMPAPAASSSPAADSGSCCRSAGPVRGPDRSCRRRGRSNPYSRPGHRRRT
ncbi:G2/M phase-specific E3 ubiquitin-protein ligase-like [Pogoniulus pusillus]|uniref:G2/M phase-specific E3 ubiquitin-protein ligase-like n=1 Tax=Pogoniulus pusillus TaxID=488313 RepID=UPI0030B96364